MRWIGAYAHGSSRPAKRTKQVWTQVVADEDTIQHALTYAQEIAAHSLPTLIMLKEAINRTFELPLTAGLDFEKRQFQATFALYDWREGMAAFLEKRRPVFRHE